MNANMTTERQQFPALMRLLHWLMAAMVLTMLGIGVAMVASLGDYHWLVSLHRPLGISILILVVIRYVNRQISAMPPFPPTMSPQERLAAHASEVLLYNVVVCRAARRLGDALRRALSDCDVRVGASFPHPSA
jgi:cytochrome b561